MNRPRLASVLACCLGIVPAAVMAADTTVIAASPLRSETMVLRVRLNTQDKGDFFVERTPGHDFLVKLQDVKAMGFKDPQGNVVTLDSEPHISLGSMQGVSFEFQESGLLLNITADPRLLPSRSFGLEG
jgi:outer membrane usher protein